MPGPTVIPKMDHGEYCAFNFDILHILRLIRSLASTPVAPYGYAKLHASTNQSHLHSIEGSGVDKFGFKLLAVNRSTTCARPEHGFKSNLDSGH